MSKSLFNTKHFPVSYVHLHGNPQIVAVLYIDKNYDVRGVEYPQDIGVNQEQLSLILDKAKSKTLSPIPESAIYAFELQREGAVHKLFYKSGYEETVDFSFITEMFALSKRFVNGREPLSEFYIKYSDFWFAGMELYGNQFLLVVDGAIDIDHLKVQMMGLFETL